MKPWRDEEAPTDELQQHVPVWVDAATARMERNEREHRERMDRWERDRKRTDRFMRVAIVIVVLCLLVSTCIDGWRRWGGR